MNKNLIDAIKNSGFSVDDITILSNTHRSLLSDYVHGNDIPSPQDAADLAELLGKPIDFLFPDHKEYYADK